MRNNNSLYDTLKMYQEQTCGNFEDVNYDLDDIKLRLVKIEELEKEILKFLKKKEG